MLTEPRVGSEELRNLGKHSTADTPLAEIRAHIPLTALHINWWPQKEEKEVEGVFKNCILQA